MRELVVLITLVLAMTIGWALAMCRWGRAPGSSVISEHSGPTIEQIQALAQLVTERVNVSDVIETQLAGRTGSIKAVVIVKGTVLISSDLSKARFESVDATARRVVLVLPQPMVLEAKVDHEQTHVAGVFESGLWRVTPSDDLTSAAVVDLAYRDAQRFVGDAAKDESLLAKARQHAEQVLGDLVRAGRWELVVKWAG